MKPIIKLYVKAFLLTGIPFGLILASSDLADGNEFGLVKFLFNTFFFGITLSLIFVSFHRYSLKKYGIQEITNDNLGVNQSGRLNTELNLTELIRTLKTDPVFGKMKMTEIENGVLLKSGVSWKSWGEEIKILLKTDQENNFEYHISSIPILKLTILDYGKNLGNIKRMENLIKNIA